jgi:hypothetical protein
MTGETHILIVIVTGIYHFIYWLFTAPASHVQPVINRLIYYVLLAIVLKWLWDLAFKRKPKK